MPRPGLVLRVEGKKVWDTENRVDRVQIMSARGEIASVGIAGEDEVIDIVVTRAGYLNRRLEDETAESQQRHREQVEEKAKKDPESERRLFGVGTNPDEDIDLRNNPNYDDESQKTSEKNTSSTNSEKKTTGSDTKK